MTRSSLQPREAYATAAPPGARRAGGASLGVTALAIGALCGVLLGCGRYGAPVRTRPLAAAPAGDTRVPEIGAGAQPTDPAADPECEEEETP